MGTVWRATDQLLARTVAVKEMHLRARGNQLTEQTARVRREAHTIARISHPNVVSVYDLVNHDERLWLVMELVDGPSLKEHVAANGPMSPYAVARIGLQLLSALEAVHAAGALHRDIKPGNVLVRNDDRVVLCDFGIAALIGADTLTATGAVVGSLGYVAPERLSGRPVGPPSDLFSLGVTLCELLSGRSPFARPGPAGMLNAILRERPEIPNTAGPLRHALKALLRKNPADRPSIAEATEMLRPLVTSVPVTNSLPKGARKSGIGTGRPLLAVATLSIALLLAAVVIAGTLSSRSKSGGEADAAGTAHPAKPSSSPGSMPSTHPSGIDAVMPVPDDPDPTAPGDYWIFSGGHYRRVNISASGYPVQKHLAASSTLEAWNDTFKNLPGFRSRIDATLPVPDSRNEYWVFSGKQYIRIRVADADQGYDDALVAGPRPLSDWKNALGDFSDDGIDAVMPTPDDPSQYWVFAGDRYLRTTLDGEGPDGHVTAGPSQLDLWTGTFKKFSAFRQRIDAAMRVPGQRNDYWVFSGTQYIKIRITDVTYDDTVLEDPNTLHNWAALP